MRLPLYQLDAFADRLFAGNPAAVVPLERFLDDATLLAIAQENNLSETAFLVRDGEDYRLRWFTPVFEVQLCGHATLASAQVVCEKLEPARRSVVFHTRSGPLAVTREGDGYSMDFPSLRPRPTDPLPGLIDAAGGRPEAVLSSAGYWVLVHPRAADVRALQPDFAALRALLGRDCVIATAPGDEPGVDFVSRFFAPGAGIDEDPVTGSAHSVLTPYWSSRLTKSLLHARQLSRRGGALVCEDRGARVRLSGRAVFYLEGSIYV